MSLRAPRDEDAAPLAEILAEPAVARYWPGYDLAAVRAELVAPHEDAVVFAIEHDGRVIGAVQYAENDDPEYRHVGVDLFLGTAFHGRGFATDALRALLSYAFVVLGHHRAVIDPAAENERALRAYRRVGFREVGVMRRYERGADGAWHDGLLMDCLAEEAILADPERRRLLDRLLERALGAIPREATRDLVIFGSAPMVFAGLKADVLFDLDLYASDATYRALLDAGFAESRDEWGFTRIVVAEAVEVVRTWPVIGHAEAWSKATTRDGSRGLRVAALEHVLAFKQASPREKDLREAELLRRAGITL